MDVVKESYVTEEDGEERKRWKQMISCGDPPPPYRNKSTEEDLDII